MRKINIFAFVFAAITTSVMAETITVTNTNTDGPGSFEQAIIDANADPSATDIIFDIPGIGNQPIFGVFPDITTPVTIDGGIGEDDIILLNNAINVPGLDIGLNFVAGSEGSTVKNLCIKEYVFGIAINTDDITVTQNTFANFGPDIRVNSMGAISTSNVSITGNTFLAEGGVLATGNPTSFTTGLEIIGNQFNESPLVVVFMQDVSILNNIFAGVSVPQAVILETVTSATISGNNLSSFTGDGFRLVGDNITISNNITSGITGMDIDIIGNDNTVSGNIVSGASIFAGIKGAGSNVLIRDNIITNGKIELSGNLNFAVNNTVTNPTGNGGFSGNGGITLTDATLTLVADNVVTDNASSNGIAVINSFNNALVRNTITGNALAGVAVFSGSDFIRISENKIFNNVNSSLGGRSGIALLGGNDDMPAPVITNVELVGDQIVISGTSESEGDLIEVFLSDALSTNGFDQNARAFLATIITSTNGDWSVSIAESSVKGDEAFFIATASGSGTTAGFNRPTSSFSLSEGISLDAARFANIGVGINELTSNGSSIFPNPFIASTTIDLKGFKSSVDVSVTDLNGVVVFEQKNQPSTTSLMVGENLKPGVYSVVVISADEVYTSKMIKQ